MIVTIVHFSFFLFFFFIPAACLLELSHTHNSCYNQSCVGVLLEVFTQQTYFKIKVCYLGIWICSFWRFIAKWFVNIIIMKKDK